MNDWQTPAAWLPPLVWAAAQVTAVTGAACLAERLARRAGPRAGGAVALAGLAAAAALSLAVFSPWPRWDGPGGEPAGEPAASVRTAGVRADADAADESAPPAAPSDAGRSVLAAARAFAAALLDPPREARPAGAPPGVGAGGETRRPVRWGLLIAAALLAAGLARFAAGWAQLARLRRRAAPVRDDEATAEFAALAAAAGVRGGAELLELDALATAAAVGRRRPAVILPGGWRAWAPADRTAVLAHELAHVAAGDFARNLLAQSLLLVQFYHPLSHLLAARVRANQELAADAAAARLVADRRGLGAAGGRSAYLKSLARLALAADGRARAPFPPASAAGWPARAFLPSPRRLTERVSMLSRPPVPLTPRRRLAGPLAVAGVLCVAAVASGFRPVPAAEPAVPAGPVPADPAPDPVRIVAPVQEEPATPRAAADAAIPDVLAYVPADADAVAVVEVKELLAAPALATMAGMLTGPDRDVRETFGVGIADVERVAFYQQRIKGDQPGEGGSLPVWVIRTVGPAPDPPELTPPPGAAAGPPEGRPELIVKADARTLVASAFGISPAMTTPGPGFAHPAFAAAAEATGEGGEGAVVRAFLNFERIRPDVLRELTAATPGRGQAIEVAAMMAFVRPLAANVDRLAMSVALDGAGGAYLAAVADAPGESAAATVTATAEAALTLARNAADNFTPVVGDGGNAVTTAMLAGMARRVLADTAVAADETRVTVFTKADAAPVAAVAAALLPATLAARRAAQRAQSQNNLKQIALAMHNYHAMYKRFPPAVIVENGVKRSWRVELLPFLDEVQLHALYRKDEPWDSRANRRVLASMPAVFRHPADDREEPFASYFAVVAENAEKSSGRFGGPTAWRAEGPPGEGFRIADVRDGTVSTIMAVESKRPVPWTKPEDVTFDAAANLNAQGSPEPPTGEWAAALKLGGFTPGVFQVAFVDGSVGTIAEAVDPSVLRAMFTRNGGEIVDRDSLPAPAVR